MNLAETDYGSAIANDASINPVLIEARAVEKLVTEFNYLRANASAPLDQFLDFISYEYMIENVMLLLRGTLRFVSIFSYFSMA